MAGFGFSGLGALFSGGSVAGATTGASGGNAAVWGTKPKTAEFLPTDLTEEQQKALAGNLSNADQIEGLLNRLVPGWSESLKQGTSNSLALLRGEIPKDVQEQVMRTAAYKSLSGGFGGSGMSKALTARDFGRTSLDLQQVGANSAQQWAKTAETAYSPWLSSGAEQAGATRTNNAGQQAYQQQVFNVAAAPDPAAAGKFAIDSAIGMQLLSFGMGAAGGAMGGAGGAAAAGGGGSGGIYNYAGQGSNGQHWQYNPSTGSYIPIFQAQPTGGAYGWGK